MQNPYTNQTTTEKGFWHLFFSTFEKAGLLCLFFALVYFSLYLALTQGRMRLVGNFSSAPNSQITSGVQNALPAGSGNVPGTTLPLENAVTADLTKMPQGNEEIAAYFSSAINKAKAEASSVTLLRYEL